MRLSERGVVFLKKQLKTAIEVGEKDREQWEDAYYHLKLKKLVFDNPDRLNIIGSISGEMEGKDVPQPVLDGFDESIKYSRLKEKFMRYAHNWNYEKAEKYHHKATEWEQANMEKQCEELATEGHLKIAAINYHTSLHGERRIDEQSGEAGYLATANEFKKNYEMRLDVLSKIRDTPLL